VRTGEASATPPSNIAAVVFWMTVAMLAFSTMAVSIRGLAGALNIFEILAVRSGSGLIVLAVLIVARPALRAEIRPRRMGLHVVRNTVHFAAQYTWAWSVTLLPLAAVFAIEFTGPAWVALLAVVLLGERLTPSRTGVLALGFAGVLVILRPGLTTFQPAALLVIAAAFGFAVALTATKSLTATTSTVAILFWMNLMQLPIALAGSDLTFLTRLHLGNVPALFGVALSGLASHYALTNAFRSGDATLVVPLDFVRIPLIALVGRAFYGEALDPFVFLGATVIIIGIVWNLRAETALRKRA
jgi:drug/metabolite transporter (DMT)-like permease